MLGAVSGTSRTHSTRLGCWQTKSIEPNPLALERLVEVFMRAHGQKNKDFRNFLVGLQGVGK